MEVFTRSFLRSRRWNLVRNRENFYYWFLLSFWSSELGNPKAWMRFIKFYRRPCFFMLLFRLTLVWRQKLNCNHWKTLRIVYVKVLLPSNLFLFLSKWILSIDDLNDAPIKITIWIFFRDPFHLYLKHIYSFF